MAKFNVSDTITDGASVGKVVLVNYVSGMYNLQDKEYL
jgi:hypothetical protein